jgi:hypothetical protein
MHSQLNQFFWVDEGFFEEIFCSLSYVSDVR